MGPVVITSLQAQEAINAAAKVKDEEMYVEIEYLDLIVKGFKMHDHCRKTFLRGFGEEYRQSTKAGGPEVIYKNHFMGSFRGVNYKQWLKNQPVLNLIMCK